MTRPNRKILYSLVLVFIAAATGCESSMATPTPAVAVFTATPPSATPAFVPPLPTSAPTVTRTAVPTVLPTAFVTPPPAGQAAIIPILMYHHLADLAPNAGELDRTWTVSPKNFQAQIAWLAEKGFHTVTMERVADHLKRGQPLPAKPIVISFDDGWADDYTVAFPALQKNHFIGTFFVYTSVIDHKQFVSWAQLIEMSAAGMDIQSHTVSHPHLRELAPAAAEKELVDSKALIEKRLGKRVTSFDYPSGEYNSATIDLVKRAGYESAVTIAAGTKQRAEDIYTLHRTRVTYADTLQDLTSRLP